MTIHKHNPWEIGSDISSLVPLPTRNVTLYAHARGPPRLQARDPVLIFFTGADGPSAVYTKVQQHLSTFVRTLFYDRAGYDRSSLPSPASKSLTAEDTALDLAALLDSINLPPPYILVGHSFGGIPLREFLASLLERKPKTANVTDLVAGVVLYDTGVELEFLVWPHLPSADLLAVSKDIDWEELTHLREESGMSDEEWQNAIEASQRTAEKGTAKREDTHGSARVLAEKRQLERHVYAGGNLVVIRCHSAGDYQIMYDEGVRLGSGTKKEREGARRFINDWSVHNYVMAKAQVDLVGGEGGNGNVLYRELMDWGHDSLFRRPTLVGDAVRWVLGGSKE